MIKYPHFQIGKGKTGIYRIRNKVNNKNYVGQAIDIRDRWLSHINSLTYGSNTILLQRSWNKHGRDNFEWLILEECAKENLTEREQYWIDTLKSADNRFGYNLTPAANSMAGFQFSEESKEKMRAWDRGTLPHAVLIEYKGVSKTRTQWAEEYGLEPGCVRSRLYMGWTIEEALETPVDDNKHFITYQGKTQPMKTWAKELGIAPNTLKHRLKVLNLSPEQAFTMNSYEGRREYYTIGDKTQTSNEWAREVGLQTRTVRQRLDGGQSIEQALSGTFQYDCVCKVCGSAFKSKHRRILCSMECGNKGRAFKSFSMTANLSATMQKES